MKPILAAGAVSAVVVLAAPGAASAATLNVDPVKPCFGAGDTLNFVGEGYTPGAIIDFRRDGKRIRAPEPIRAEPDGSVRARLTVVRRGGQRRRTYAAVDRTNSANRASVEVPVSGLAVRVRPRGGRSNEARRITAMGFTTGSRTLWAHIVFAGRVRTLRIGALSGPCRRLTATKRLFGARPPAGQHRVYFDTSRRFRSRGLRQQIWFPFDISRSASRAGATAAAAAR
jgi:hypothetical protein